MLHRVMTRSVVDFYKPVQFIMSVFLSAVKCLLIWCSASLPLPARLSKRMAVISVTLERDIKHLSRLAKALVAYAFCSLTGATVVSEFGKIVKKWPDKKCFIFEDDSWTFTQVDDYSNKIANVFRSAGYKKGDVLALMMTNRLEYASIWLGLAKIGVTTALVNTNLKSQPLLHSLKVAKCKGIIFSDDLSHIVLEVRHQMDSSTRYFQLGGPAREGVSSLDNFIKAAPSTIGDLPSLEPGDHLIYIYTSGTTGLPKAAIIPNSRFLMLAVFVKYIIDVNRSDVVYNPLPLYHSAGGALGVSAAFTIGCTIVIKQKFSASSYISDCIKYDCTIAQYIGEMCRFILATPPTTLDQSHRLRLIVGNGLKSVLWKQFVDRFNISNVMELYGSTEGNVQFVNFDNKPGAIGSIPQILPRSWTANLAAVIRVDLETMEPIRDKNGLCVQCQEGEPGMVVGVIPKVIKSFKEVHGYLDKKESNKKFIYDVFKKGDRAFVTGDIVEMDSYGYLYFKDRTGDTFRWKGENVSTSEVEAVITNLIGLKDCAVYGVEVGNLEGKAGMVAIADDPLNRLNLTELAKVLDESLPKYAQPIFVRIMPEMELTGTFKFKKFQLQKEGFNPDVVRDPIFYRKGAGYFPLGEDVYQQIIKGEIRI